MHPICQGLHYTVGSNMIVTLKQYDFELLTFELRQEGLDGFACSILSVNEAKCHLLIRVPLGLDCFV